MFSSAIFTVRGETFLFQSLAHPLGEDAERDAPVRFPIPGSADPLPGAGVTERGGVVPPISGAPALFFDSSHASEISRGR